MTKAAHATTAALAALGLGAKEQEARMGPRSAPPKPGKPEVERLHLHLPPAAIRTLKVCAAERGVSPSQIVLDALRQAGVL
jgi:hypothetical protein